MDKEEIERMDLQTAMETYFWAGIQEKSLKKDKELIKPILMKALKENDFNPIIKGMFTMMYVERSQKRVSNELVEEFAKQYQKTLDDFKKEIVQKFPVVERAEKDIEMIAI